MTTTTQNNPQPDPTPEPRRADAVASTPRRVDAVAPIPSRVDPVREPCRVDTIPRTIWHITFGTYAARLHNDPRPTVDRRHNTPGEPFPPPDPSRQQPPTDPALKLTHAQCIHIEQTIPLLCERGGWTYHTCAAPREPRRHDTANENQLREPGRAGPDNREAPVLHADHIHVLLAAPCAVHGKQIRHWLKRWLTQSLAETFGPPPKRWWADAGSTKPVTDAAYLYNATNYINNQRTTSAS